MAEAHTGCRWDASNIPYLGLGGGHGIHSLSILYFLHVGHILLHV